MDAPEPRRETDHTPLRAERLFFVLGTVVLVIVALWLVRDQAIPVAIAVLIWFLISALANALRGHLPRLATLPAIVAKLLSTLVLFGVIALGGHLLSTGLGELARDAATRQDAVVDAVAARMAAVGLDFATIDLSALLDRLRIDEWIRWAVRFAHGLIADIALVFLYVMFLLVDERFFDAKLRALAPDPNRQSALRETLASLAETTRVYLWLMSLISAGVAVMTFALCALLGVEGAGVWGVLAFALNFVPTLGSILAVLLPATYAIFTLDTPTDLVLLVLGLAAVQFVAGEVVVPRVMGDRLNLSSFVILLTLVAWGAIWGAVGMFLAIPITVILALIAARFDATRPVAILLSRDGRVPDAVVSPDDQKI